MQSNNEQKGAALTRISQLQHQRKMRRLRKIALAAVLALAVAIYVTGVWRQAFSAVEDMAESIRIAMTPDAGWPAKTGIPDILQAEPLAGGFAELGKEDLAVYSAGGNHLRSIQHGYARPAMSVGNHRFCLYNRSGTELRIESRTRTLYTKSFQQPIVLAQMSPNGSVAVVTGGKLGTAELTVLDPSMKFRYSWKSENEGLPSMISFADDNHRLAVACLGAHNGMLQSNIYLLDTHSDQVTAKITANGSHVLQMHWLTSEKLLVIYNSLAIVYEAATGREMAVFSFEGQPLASASVCGQNTALLFSRPLADTPARLLVLDSNMQILASTQVAAPAERAVLTRTTAYVLRKSSVAAYTMAGEFMWEKQLEAPPIAVLAAKQPLVLYGGQAAVLKEPTQADET